jgi:hypothetical protein
VTLDRDQIARRKRVVVHQAGDHVHEEHVVENVNLEYREALYKVSQLIWLLFGGLEALIGIRVILMLLGANPANAFTAFVYHIHHRHDCLSTDWLGHRPFDLGAFLPCSDEPGHNL